MNEWLAMLIRRCAGTSVFLLFTLFNLLIFLSVETSARERNLYFAESAPKPLKNNGKHPIADRELDNRMQKRPSSQARSRKNTLKKSPHVRASTAIKSKLEELLPCKDKK